jgi:hypothetical protein
MYTTATMAIYIYIYRKIYIGLDIYIRLVSSCYQSLAHLQQKSKIFIAQSGSNFPLYLQRRHEQKLEDMGGESKIVVIREDTDTQTYTLQVIAPHAL